MLALALLVSGCAAEEAELGDQSADATEDERLRVQGPPTRLVPGEWLRDQRLAHAVVEADVSLQGLLVANVDVAVPADFWVEVAGYLVALEEGDRMTVDVAGPEVTLYTRVVGDRTGQLYEGQPIELTASRTADHLVMIVPLSIEPGADHIEYDIRATISR
jgi:hypothetical protein